MKGEIPVTALSCNHLIVTLPTLPEVLGLPHRGIKQNALRGIPPPVDIKYDFKKTIAIIVCLVLSLGAAAIDRNGYSPTIPAFDGETLSILQGNTIVATSSVEIPVKRTEMPSGAILIDYPAQLPTNGVLAAAGDYTELLNCLIYYESKGNERAFNKLDTDGRPKFGLLQFGWAEFQDFCVSRYGLENDIWSGKIQVECWKLMVRDGYLGKWGTLKYCL